MVVLGLLSLLIEPKIEHSHLIGPTKVSYSSQFHFPNQNRICIPSYTRNQTPPKLSWQTSRPTPPPYKYTHPTRSSLNLLSHLSLCSSLCFAISDRKHNGAQGRIVRTVSQLVIFSIRYRLFSNPNFANSVFNSCLVWFGVVVVTFLFQEIGEEGLFDGDSGEEEVAESACRWRGGQRRQLRCRFAPWHHGKAPAFPWRHDSYQGIRFNLGIYAFCGCLFVFIAKFCSWSLGLWIVVCVVRFGCGILEFCFVGLVW